MKILHNFKYSVDHQKVGQIEIGTKTRQKKEKIKVHCKILHQDSSFVFTYRVKPHHMSLLRTHKLNTVMT